MSAAALSVVARQACAMSRTVSRRVATTRAAAEEYYVDLSPGFNFFRVEAIIRPWRLPFVLKALDAGGIRGVTAYEVTGSGVQRGENERYGGNEYGEASIGLIAKTKVEVVVVAAQVNDVVNIIVDAAQTGEPGDGKLFVIPVSEVIRIRTGEHGAAAERMEGGRDDMMRAQAAPARK